MRILALDCSAKAVSAAIAADGRLLSEGFLNIPLTHSETLMPLCEQVLQNVRLSLREIDCLAVTAGPGSFTGIRIGISAVKGMCFAEKKSVYPFSTLAAMALSLRELPLGDCVVCGLMDARREQFYNALFEFRGSAPRRLTEDRLISAEALAKELKNRYNNKKVILTGDGARLFESLIPAAPNLFLAPEAYLMQRACGIALAASRADCPVVPVSADALQPIYLRKSQAEREREQALHA